MLIVDPTSPTVVGHPVAGVEYWLCEGEEGTCGPQTVAVVLADVLGVPLHSNAEVKVRALSLDLIGFDLHPGRVPGPRGTGPERGWRGMSAPDVATLCASYGVKVEVERSSPDDLAARLAGGAAVLVCLDTEQLRVGGTGGTPPGLGLDGHHALNLTGIDPAAGLVFLNNPSGAGVVVPLGQFCGAWAEAGDAALLGHLPPGGHLGWPLSPAAADPWAALGESVAVAELTAAAAPPRTGLVWLPFAFVARTAAPAA